MSTNRIRTLLIVAACLTWCPPLRADQPAGASDKSVRTAGPSKFIRVVQDDNKNPVALQTATVRYTSASADGKVTVDLIGVVHIGDRGYYQKLNKQFEHYDAVLYELVAPQGTRIPKGGKSANGNPLTMLQTGMKIVLGLESQTEQIDYSRKNFVHADLSLGEMAEVIQKRGDSGLTLALSIAADLLRQQNVQEQKKSQAAAQPEPELDLWSLLVDQDAPVKLKRMMANQLVAAGGDSGLGPTVNAILIGDRNAAALKVLQKELAKGHTKIAIFYGAAHMPDFEKRLREEFGLRPQRTQWLNAWNLQDRPLGVLEDLLKQFLP